MAKKQSLKGEQMPNVPNLAIEELKRLIHESGSQGAVAEKLDIPQSQLSEILNGRRDPSRSILDKIGFQRVIVDVSRDDVPEFLNELELTINSLRGVKRLRKALNK